MLREETTRAWQAVGQVTYGGTQAEEKSRAYRRSLYIARDMAAGEALTPESLRAVRPGFGLPPKFYDQLLGKKVTRAVTAGTPLDWDLVA